jgi:hypothetical protein
VDRYLLLFWLLIQFPEETHVLTTFHDRAFIISANVIGTIRDRWRRGIDRPVNVGDYSIRQRFYRNAPQGQFPLSCRGNRNYPKRHGHCSLVNTTMILSRPLRARPKPSSTQCQHALSNGLASLFFVN